MAGEAAIKNHNYKGVQVYFKGGQTMKSLLLAPKDKDYNVKKVEWYKGSDVAGWTVMMSILVYHQEHLEKVQRTSEGPLSHL